MRSLSPSAPLVAGVMLGVCLSLGHGQQPIRFTHRVDVLDLSHCLAEPGAVPVTLEPGDLNLEIVDWTTEAKAEPFVGEFTLKLHQATLIGSVVLYDADSVEYRALDQWKRIEPGPEKGRRLQMLPIPAGDLIEALRVRVLSRPRPDGDQTRHQATLVFLSLIPLRTLNVAMDATVTASSVAEALPAVLVDGVVASDRNFSTGPREEPTSAAFPEWVLLTWEKVQSIRGIEMFRGSQEQGFGDSVAEVFKGEGDPAAAMARNEEWEKIIGRVTAPGRFRAHQLFVSPSSMETRGVRIRSLGGTKQVALGELMVLSDLGYAPGPVTATPLGEAKPAAADGESADSAGK